MSRGLCSVLQLLRRISIVKQDSAASCFTGLPIAFFHSQYGRDHIVQPLGGNYSQQIRYYAARKGKREKMEKAKKARKLKEVKKEIIVPRRFASK